MTKYRYSKNPIDKICDVCGENETRKHFIAYCQKYDIQREKYIQEIYKLTKLDYYDLTFVEMLGGSNRDIETKKHLELCLQNYVKSTGRKGIWLRNLSLDKKKITKPA